VVQQHEGYPPLLRYFIQQYWKWCLREDWIWALASKWN